MFALGRFIALIRRLTIRSQQLAPALVTNTSVIQTPIVVTHLLLGFEVFTDDDTFYTHTINHGALLIPLVSDGDTFYEILIANEGDTLFTPVFTNTNTFYTHTIVTVASNQLDFSTGAASGLVGAFWP